MPFRLVASDDVLHSLGVTCAIHAAGNGQRHNVFTEQPGINLACMGKGSTYKCHLPNQFLPMQAYLPYSMTSSLSGDMTAGEGGGRRGGGGRGGRSVHLAPIGQGIAGSWGTAAGCGAAAPACSACALTGTLASSSSACAATDTQLLGHTAAQTHSCSNTRLLQHRKPRYAVIMHNHIGMNHNPDQLVRGGACSGVHIKL